MLKNYNSLGLMSGTSGDGVDASIIKSNGIDQFEPIKDKYFEYDSKIYKKIHSLKKEIHTLKDLDKFSEDIKEIERKITLFHAKIIKDLEFHYDENDLIGFHGQTIYHNSDQKTSIQLGDSKLLYQLIKKKIIYNFRKNDLLNGGEGAPLTPIFHQLLATKFKFNLPICFLNIGGISNITIVKKPIGSMEILSKDLGPGNCLIDEWVRSNSNKKFDKDGKFAATGKINEIILEQAIELYINSQNKKKLSFDTRDFDISFSRGLSLEDGAATLTEFTANIIGETLSMLLSKEISIEEILICGGGRKNNILLKSIAKNLKTSINLRKIDEFGVNGDFVESQAFAFLAIRSYKKLPISFPNTTNCKNPCLGGELEEN